MHYPVYYLLGMIFIGLGARYAVRGYAHKSKPRIVNGIAIAMIGVAQFLREIRPLAIAIIAAGFRDLHIQPGAGFEGAGPDVLQLSPECEVVG